MRNVEIQKANDQFFKKSEEANSRIFESVKSYLLSLTSGGKLSLGGQQLSRIALQIQQEITRAVDQSEYYDGVQSYKATIGIIERIIIEQYAEITGVSVNNVVEANPFRGRVMDSLDNHLSGNAFYADILEPIRNIIVQQILYGISYEKATEIIEEFISKKGLDSTLRNVNSGQVGRDLLNQYDGAIQNEIRKEYEFNGFIWVGGHVEDTRPVCDHLADRENGQWSMEELSDVLDEYCPNGEPSQEMISYETITDDTGQVVKKRAKKGAGMIRGTSLDNFAIVRGGFNCLHELVFIYL